MYAVPPYNLDPTEIAYMFIGPLVGPLIVTGIFFFWSDPLALYLARRNNGVFEVSEQSKLVPVPSLTRSPSPSSVSRWH